MTDHYNPADVPEADVVDGTQKDDKPKRVVKRSNDPTLRTARVLKAVQSLGGNGVTISEVTHEIYGNDTKTRHGRVNHHMQKLVKEGTLKKTGTPLHPVFHLNDGKPSNTASTGDLFELVGKIGDTMAVRSLDTSQIYKLEEV